MYLNKCQIIGNITKDPELKSLPRGVPVCSFSVATNEVFVKDGEKKEKVEYHNIVCFNKTAENVAKYMKKGSQVYIEGKLQTRTWEDQNGGGKKYRTEIIVDKLQFGSNKNNSTSTDKNVNSNDIEVGGYDGEISEDINNEDIPF